MPRSNTIPQIPLPKAWSTQVKSAVLHVIALAQYALIYSRSWAADGGNQRVRLRAECDRLEQEAALLREEIRIKDLRMTQIEPPRRPHYPPTARIAILELRSARCWSLEQTARPFLLTAETVSSWVRRKDETGATALVQIAQPVNRYSDRFYGKPRDGAHKVDTSDLMRRMVKEELVKFDNTPLFPNRKAYTANYKLSDALKKNGGDPKLTVYSEAGHDSWTATYPGFPRWLEPGTDPSSERSPS